VLDSSLINCLLLAENPLSACRQLQYIGPQGHLGDSQESLLPLSVQWVRISNWFILEKFPNSTCVTVKTTFTLKEFGC
jgi:hypothetical protein